MEITLKKEYLQGSHLFKEWDSLVDIYMARKYVRYSILTSVLRYFEIGTLNTSSIRHVYVEARCIYCVFSKILDNNLTLEEMAIDVGRHFTAVNRYLKLFWELYQTDKRFRFKVHSIVIGLDIEDQYKIAEKLQKNDKN